LLTAATPRTAAQNPQPVPPRVVAIKAGKLVDPEKGTRRANQIILVRDEKLKAVGANVQIPADAHVIDLSNSTVLPGLFDAHTHLCMTVKKDRDAGSYYITTLLDPTPYRAIEGVANARICWPQILRPFATSAMQAIMPTRLCAKPSSAAWCPARRC